MAKKVKVEKLVYSGGQESQISGLGGFLSFVGVIGFIVCVIVGLGATGLSSVWIAVGIFSLIQGITVLVMFNAGAEVIRLLKKLNGLNFSGVISEPKVETQTELKCSKCGNDAIFENNTRCSKCGEKFESTTKEET